MTPEELEAYTEQAAIVPDGTICTIDISILRELLCAESKLFRVHNVLDVMRKNNNPYATSLELALEGDNQ